eukprot:4878225-Karenia_brevis.AAC.1
MSRLAPRKMRLPIPLVILAALLGALMYSGGYVEVMRLLFQYYTYLRPGVNDNVRGGQLPPPSPRAGQ